MHMDYSSMSVDQITTVMCQHIASLQDRQIKTPQQRMLVALAGVPAPGKSTIFSALMQKISGHDVKYITVVPMATLATSPYPGLAPRRRVTFDAAAFVQLVVRLKKETVTLAHDHESWIGAPSLNHEMQDPVADDIKISFKR
ncbi:uncharacterized protein A1O9_07454 [Exophiala aquamarina CBS 119918]|uniref:Uncharacterized protein n=1 Tax=Exophiala aquamarina CBS 119918 TaxID=1182545 RepID=A0A072P6Z0_9EURO|nr:uncharacterized protein A1O9_07454 [Exophiala aquamarina CBS 119918]KEF55874.1 hypothetical protein A1O9_07454 [Exophiala aquamarina CBS 119918]